VCAERERQKLDLRRANGGDEGRWRRIGSGRCGGHQKWAEGREYAGGEEQVGFQPI